MFSWFKKDPSKKLTAQIKAKYEESVRLQRNGKLREYGVLMSEIEELEKQLTAMKEKQT